MSTFLVIDGVACPQDLWSWYHDKKKEWVAPTASLPIDVFFNIVPTSKQHVYRNYNDMSGWVFYEFLNSLLRLYTDLEAEPMPSNITMDRQYRDLLLVEQMQLYWVFTTGHTKDQLGEYAPDNMVDEERRAFNIRYHVLSGFIMMAIWEGFNNLKQIMSNLNISHIRNMGNDTDDNIMILKKHIGECYYGEYDEFIICTMDRIKFVKMTKGHERIARVKSYDMMKNDNFDEPFDSIDTWRFLFNGYFDEVEDKIDVFLKHHPGPCVEYLLLDYYSKMDVFKYIPVYKIFTNNNSSIMSYNIFDVINISELLKQ